MIYFKYKETLFEKKHIYSVLKKNIEEKNGQKSVLRLEYIFRFEVVRSERLAVSNIYLCKYKINKILPGWFACTIFIMHLL